MKKLNIFTAAIAATLALSTAEAAPVIKEITSTALVDATNKRLRGDGQLSILVGGRPFAVWASPSSGYSTGTIPLYTRVNCAGTPYAEKGDSTSVWTEAVVLSVRGQQWLYAINTAVAPVAFTARSGRVYGGQCMDLYQVVDAAYPLKPLINLDATFSYVKPFRQVIVTQPFTGE